MFHNRKTLRTRLFAGAAAVALSMSVVACSEAEDAADSAGDAVSSATDSAGSALNEATSELGAESAADAPDGGSGETTEVESADGSTIEIPTAVAAAAEQAGFSVPESVENGPNGASLVTYPEGLIVHSADSGAQPLVGKIAETWMGEGGLEAAVGLPTAPEEPTSEGNGWTQEFTGGVISWVADGSGEFTADVQAG